MSTPSQAPKVLAVIGSSGKTSSTATAIHHISTELEELGCTVDILDLGGDPLPLFNPETSYQAPYYADIKARVEAADVLLLGTPDYHGCISSSLKNFLDHFWKEYAGKLMASIVGSYEKGLTVTDQLRTFARQCNAWAMPYGVAFMDKADVNEGKVVGDALPGKLTMLANDIRTYGGLLAAQKSVDLAGSQPGFMARYRPK